MDVGPILDNLLVTPLTLYCMSPREDCGDSWEGCKSWKILWMAERIHSPYSIKSLQSLVNCTRTTLSKITQEAKGVSKELTEHPYDIYLWTIYYP